MATLTFASTCALLVALLLLLHGSATPVVVPATGRLQEDEDVDARVRTLQQTLRETHHFTALPDPPRTMGVHTACKKYAVACPAEYAAFLQAYVDGLPLPASLATPHVAVTNASELQTLRNDSAMTGMVDVASSSSTPSCAVDRRWSYVQREHLENLQDLAAVLEAKLRNVSRSTPAAACALHRVRSHGPACVPTPARTGGVGAAVESLRQRIMCVWWSAHWRCVPRHTVPALGLRAWVGVMDVVRSLAPWVWRAFLLVVVVNRAVWVAFGDSWPAEQLELLQQRVSSLAAEEPESAVSTTTTLVTCAEVGASRATALDALAARSRTQRVTATLFALLDEHFACETPYAFLRLRLALYLLIDLAQLLTAITIVVYTHDLFSPAQAWVMPGSVAYGVMPRLQWGVQLAQRVLHRLVPSWMVVGAVVAVLSLYVVRLLSFTLHATLQAHDELMQLDLKTAGRRKSWLERLP